MPPRLTKTSGRHRRWLRWLLPAIGLLILYSVFAGPRGLLKVADLRAQKKQIMLEIDSLETRKRELVLEKARLLSDTTYLEMLARKELGMARPGGKVYRFATPAAADSNARTESRR